MGAKSHQHRAEPKVSLRQELSPGSEAIALCVDWSRAASLQEVLASVSDPSAPFCSLEASQRSWNKGGTRHPHLSLPGLRLSVTLRHCPLPRGSSFLELIRVSPTALGRTPGLNYRKGLNLGKGLGE